jgi:hypothetical protein
MARCNKFKSRKRKSQADSKNFIAHSASSAEETYYVVTCTTKVEVGHFLCVRLSQKHFFIIANGELVVVAATTDVTERKEQRRPTIRPHTSVPINK